MDDERTNERAYTEMERARTQNRCQEWLVDNAV
jgi:hypothetical protein